jgi:DNA-binding MarR family transcriptional regulator
MRLFEKLRALRAYEKQHLDFLDSVEDHHLISEIGYHQAKGKPLTLKQLSLLDVGSIATVQRRLRRLKELGLVQHRRSASDRRAIELTLSPKCLRVLAKYDSLMSSKAPAPGNGESSHACGLCDSDAGRRNLLATFLGQGLKRGDKCVLVARADIQDQILAALPDRRRAPRNLVVSEGYDASNSHLAFLKRVSQEAKRAGQSMRLAAEMSWTLSRNLRFDDVLDIETRLDVLVRQRSMSCLCVYDARRFSSGEFLHAAACHRHPPGGPVVLG